ncbi:hypothetical protein ACFFX1_20685 [Dactylosporangium sucinum]|uniref:Lipoprotein n=1 Tax=Dactylosporangium sucinum TaxID=1424081 RepID=A0A917X8L1_9ACTN|nr:hypothetical protein [Dactylosporangium sucinum]GGM89772.1 hypothetical protein GCM10007977_109800 [Dactylosporangium sucinum]
MRKIILMAAAVSLALVAGCGESTEDVDAGQTPSASGSPSTSAPSSEKTDGGGVAYFQTKLTPDANVAAGTVLTATATGAKPSTSYYCLVAAYSTEQAGVSAPLMSSLTKVESGADGSLACKVTYQPFEAQDTRGVVRHCPTTAADRKDGFLCGVALADAATTGALSASVASFTPAE